MSGFSLREGLIFGLGNPLLDISASVEIEFLNKWGLKPDNAILADDRHNGLVDDLVKDHEVKFIAGGSVQNTMRMAQWIIGKPNICVFMGSIGKDFFGRCMQFKATEDGVNCQYSIDQTTKTGHCVVLITNNGKSRSLCAFLGAANNFKIEHLLKNWNFIENALLFYVSGFHLTVSPDSILAIAKHAAEHDEKTFTMNLSAPFISELYSKQLLDVLPYVDILIGNETEAIAFAKMKKWKTVNITEIASLMANMEKTNQNKPRMVIITQGSDPILVAKQKKKELETFPVTKLDVIVDTNGAGDAFVAGFISQYIQQKSLDKCISVGIYAAHQIIKQDGCSIPKFRPVLDE